MQRVLRGIAKRWMLADPEQMQANEMPGWVSYPQGELPQVPPPSKKALSVGGLVALLDVVKEKEV